MQAVAGVAILSDLSWHGDTCLQEGGLKGSGPAI